ncbi:Inner membrane protein YrbG [Hydrogenovibrio crunogenus]|uniref:Inner membrane protein YrbG n=1 Tax=Hydrogenovibrio crunogenus TaxID=39765 RepID=A0A4P7NYV3_9GAMM|nr:calcium/sodium antiporter [Hydrogenovibrio crunogenus]QBZ83000.1 Inner membrane protein YrbG [Hydrogenovibrio crunogenus]RUM93266.1 MAG: calcium/sodium antiporter [Thiomicrospira sp.]
MTSSLILPLIVLFVGLALLVWSSDIFIEGAASTAIHMNISPLIIGVVVLGFGTSAPEILVAILASIDDSPGLAIGNVVGSNIANIGLVLGVTAIISPVVIKSSLLKREFPILLAISLVGILLMLDQDLDFTDGIILLALLLIVMTWMIRANKNINPNDPLAEETIEELEDLPKLSNQKALSFLILGLVILMISAKMMVWGAVEIAHFFHVPEMIIGLTIVAIGTSLPELAAAITAAKKGEADLMIGNILGSNLFNLLAVMSMPALIAPSVIDNATLLLDYPIMLALTLAMLLVALPRKGKAVITKTEGYILLISFIGYMLLLYFRSVAG